MDDEKGIFWKMNEINFGIIETVITENDAAHMEAVKKTENGRVYIIEVNFGDACGQQDYPIGSSLILSIWHCCLLKTTISKKDGCYYIQDY